MPVRQPVRLVVGQSSLAGGVLPDERLQRQINADRLIRLHQRSAATEIAKDNDPVGRNVIPASGAKAAWLIRARTLIP